MGLYLTEKAITNIDFNQQDYREQLEREFAARFDTQAALLCHSTTAAMTAVLGALDSQGKKIVVAREGDDTQWHNSITADLHNKADARAILEQEQPDAIVLRVFAENTSELYTAFPATLFIVNGDVVNDNVIGVAEVKGFLPQQQGGIIYGSEAVLQPIREYARENDLLLGDTVLPYFSEPLVRTAKQQDTIQQDNTAALHDALQQHLPTVFNVTRSSSTLTITHADNDKKTLHALQQKWQSAYRQYSDDGSSDNQYPRTSCSFKTPHIADEILSLDIAVGLEPQNTFVHLAKLVAPE